MQKVDKNPSDHIKSLPDDVRADVAKLDKEISKIMKGSTRVLWEGVFWGGSQQAIIGYGDLTYHDSKGKAVEWFVVGLALQKNYISVYINAVQKGVYLAEGRAKDLGKAKVGKSSVAFKKLEDINLDVLLSLVAKAKELSAG